MNTICVPTLMLCTASHCSACNMRMCARVAVSSAQKAKLSRIVTILVLRSVTVQLCCRSYRYPYTLVLLKRSHCCLFCTLRANEEAKKAVVVRNHATTFERIIFSKSCTTKILNAIKNPMKLRWRCINKVCSC